MKSARRFLKSASAPAGSVKKKKGREAAVVNSDRSKLEVPDEVCMSQVATVLWAAIQTSETRPDNHSHRKTRFLSANHTELFCFSLLATSQSYDGVFRAPCIKDYEILIFT